jgi:DNA polymerase-3 subunit beta
MKVEVTQQLLAHGLSLVSRAVSPRSTLPVLANILLASDEGRLRLSATNLEMGITCWIPAKIEEEGSTTVPARTISDLVSTLPNDNIKLELDIKHQSLTVKCGAAETVIKGIDAQEFPPLPVVDVIDGINLNVSDFKEMIQQVAFAASADEARPVLQGVLMKVAESEVTLAATDGFRISVRKAALKTPAAQPLSAIIPARALGELARIAEDGDESIHMIIPSGRGQVIFHLKNAELVSQLIEGNFPDYNAIIPHSFKTHSVVSKEAFLKSCKQAEVIARDSNYVIRLDITPQGTEPGLIKISALSEETGSSDIEVDANIDGPELAIAFNVRFLREVLEVIKAANVSIDTNANNTPALVKPVGDDNYTHVIMPMHLG